MTEERKTQIVVPDRPQVGDMGLSFLWTDTISDHVERIARLGGDFLTSTPAHYCKLTGGSLKPSGATDTSPQTRLADVFGKKKDGSFVDTSHDILITNRTSGYFYQNSFVWAARHPQSGEWHVVFPAGDKVIGKTDGALSPGGTATLSIYKWTGAAWSDTTDDVTIRDVFQWTVSASKFVGAHLWDYQNIWVPYAAEC